MQYTFDEHLVNDNSHLYWVSEVNTSQMHSNIRSLRQSLLQFFTSQKNQHSTDSTYRHNVHNHLNVLKL